MKKIDKSLHKNFLPIRVFIEDLEEIEKFLKENIKDFDITAKDYEYDNIQELIDHCKTVTIPELEIYCYQPHIYISLSKRYAFLHVSEDDPKSAGIYFHLERILKKCQLSLPWLYSLPCLLLFSCLVWLNSFYIYFIPKADIILTSIMPLWTIYYIPKVLYIYFARFSHIVLEHKIKGKNFFQRNKDQLILILITVILTALGTLAVKKYFL